MISSTSVFICIIIIVVFAMLNDIIRHYHCDKQCYCVSIRIIRYLDWGYKMKKSLVYMVLVSASLAACNYGNSSANQSAGVQQQILNETTTFDSSRIGFAMRFNGQSGDVDVAFAPYNEQGDDFSADKCPHAHDVYTKVVAPIISVSPNSTLQHVWDHEEYFNCHSGTTNLIVNSINKAESSIYAAVYELNNPDIAYALINKKDHNPHMDIQVVADKSNLSSTNSMIAVLKEHNIPVYISSAFNIMHNKFMVFDGKAVQYGSLNYTTAAAVEQANNVVVIDNNKVAATYLARWQQMFNNESTAVYEVGQSKYTDQPYIPASFTAVVHGEKTGTYAQKIYHAKLDTAQIDVVHDLANILNADKTCPDSLKTLGICLYDYNYKVTDETTGKTTTYKYTPFYSLVDSAKSSIKIAIFALSDSELLYRLKKAQQRGVDVKVVADYNWNMDSSKIYSIVQKLADAGIEVRTNNHYEILHDKYMIVDDVTVQTGSYNYTASASTANAENYQIYYNQPELANLYLQDWQIMFDEGDPVVAQ